MVDLLACAAKITEPAEWPTMARAFEGAALLREGPEPPFSIGLTLILRLLEADELHAAHKLSSAMDAWRTTQRERAALLPEALARRWAMVREMVAVSQSFPSGTLRQMAAALREEDLVKARREMKLLQLLDAEVASHAWTVLGQLAPTITATIWEPEPPPRPQRREYPPGTLRLAIWFFIAFLMFVSKALESCKSSHQETPPSPTTENSP
ncbi:MAG TPA: hypothetical protein VH877_02255 [Polyangia bacterium]|nr:hypothetical protein [Polyangia bacterium]